MTDIITKYSNELNSVTKFINNDFIYKIFYDYGFTLNKKFIPLDSNINVFEACFISLLINIYIKKYKNKNKLNILEIGLAFGTSALIIINQLIQYKYAKSYDIIDPNQTIQWKSTGIKNINNFLEVMKKKLNYKLYEESSILAMLKLKKKYDISFIDGSHDEKIVIQDLINSDKLLIKNGLIIIDDVLHKGVRNAIIEFVKIYKNYKRISINKNEIDFIDEKILYNTKEIKKSYICPNTMFCFQKIY